MGSDVIFGQYIKGDSVIHQLDARMKIIIAILYIVIIFLNIIDVVKGPYPFLMVKEQELLNPVNWN